MSSTSTVQSTLRVVARSTEANSMDVHAAEETLPSSSTAAPKSDIDYHATWPNDQGFDTVREERVPIELAVEGIIPTYAAGILIRNGPGSRLVLDDKGKTVYTRSHWFDGFAQLHRFDIRAGNDGGCKVTYRSRTQVDKLLESLRETRSFPGYTFAQKRDPCQSLFRKFMTAFRPGPQPQADYTNVPITVSANTAILDGETSKSIVGTNVFVTRTDESLLQVVDAETLEPIGIAHQNKLHPLLKGPMSASHAKADPKTGDVFNYNLDLGYKIVYRVFMTSAVTGQTDILATISSEEIQPAYIHSLFLSGRFVILCVWNAHLAGRGAKVLWERNILDAISPFDKSKSARWFVIDRKHGKGVVAKFESHAFYAFHAINAWEEAHEDGAVDIICDVIQYDDLDILHKFYYDNLRSSGPTAAAYMREKDTLPTFARYRLGDVSLPEADAPPLDLPWWQYGRAKKIMILPSPIAGELPTINTAYSTRAHRFFYCSTSRSLATFGDGLTKVDTHTGSSIAWDNPVGHTPSEAIFVADPTGTNEDDGVLLTIVLDGFGDTSYLLCLDARTMKELGRADCRGPININFHGQHVRVNSDGSFVRPTDM